MPYSKKVPMRGRRSAKKTPVRGSRATGTAKSTAGKARRPVNKGSKVSALARSAAGGKAVSALARKKKPRLMTIASRRR